MSFFCREVLKDPEADLDYGFDWSQWLGLGDTIQTSVWSVAPVGNLILHNDSILTGKQGTIVWLRGGTDGHEYVVTDQITTAGGRQDERSLKVKVIQRFIPCQPAPICW